MRIKLFFVILTTFLILGSCSKSDPSTPTSPTATAPVINITTAISAITTTAATSGGNVTSDGGASITARGVCWNTSSGPTIANNKTIDGSGTGAFTSGLTGLTPGTVYYVRAYATNSVGTSYAPELSFTTGVTLTLPALGATSVATNITTTTAVSGGNVLSDGGASVTTRGVCWGTSSNPTTANSKTTDGAGTGAFISNLTGLAANTVYYVRAYATNSVGTAYASEISFTASLSVTIPTLAVTSSVTSITSVTAISGGNVLSDGGANVTSRGVCWSASSGPTILNTKTINGAGTGSFTSNLTGLTANTLYYVRAYATNSVGTAYGTEISFTASPNGTITICSAVWMDKNLSVTTYSNGDPIPLVTDPAQWAALTTGAYCYYNNDPSTEAIYGRLYNWYAASDPRGLAPAGWHVATSAEWVTMRDCLGGMAVAGGKIKEAGTVHWNNPNTGATNSSGFTALGGGYRTSFGPFDDIGGSGRWWSFDTYNSTLGQGANVYYNTSDLWSLVASDKTGGQYVRCVKN